MNIKVWFVLVLALVSALAFNFSCDDSEEDDAAVDDGDQQEQPEKQYNTNLEGFAAGSAMFAYSNGRWAADSDVDSDLPVYELFFADRDDGYAGTQGALLRYDGTWSDITPSGYSGQIRYVRIIREEGGLYVLAQTALGDDSWYFLLPADQSEWSVINPKQLFGREDAYIEDLDLVSGLGAVLLITWDEESHLVTFDSTGASTSITPSPRTETSQAIFTTLSVVSGGEQPKAWVGGYRNLQIPQGPDPNAGVDDDDNFAEETEAFLMSGWGETWVEEDLGTSCDFERVELVEMTTANNGYASVYCINSEVLRYNGVNWIPTEMPQSKTEDFRVSDMSFIDDVVGWAVGYSSEFKEPLMALHSVEGWEIARPSEEERGSGKALYAVSMYPTPEDADDDDSVDDDDIVDDDDTVDDDDVVDDDDAVDDDDTV